MNNQFFIFGDPAAHPKNRITAEDLQNRFSEWLILKAQSPAEKAMLRYYSSEIVIRTFLSDPAYPGMSDIYQESDFAAIRETLVPVLKAKPKPPEKHVSTIRFKNQTVEIEHIGDTSDSLAAWQEILRGLNEDIGKGHGIYPLDDLRSAAKWQVIH